MMALFSLNVSYFFFLLSTLHIRFYFRISIEIMQTNFRVFRCIENGRVHQRAMVRTYLCASSHIIRIFSPYRIGDDIGSAFAMGLVGGSIFQAFGGYKNAAKGKKLVSEMNS